VVAASGMPYVIVRPTIVAGQGSGAWQGLLKLARAPITPIFGNGRARLQPIHVDDLVDALLHVVRERKFANEAIDLGGPEVIDVESLLRRMRQAVGRRPGPVIHLPLRTTRKLLGNLERPLFPLLPMTAGQLSVFAEDSTAAASSLWQRLAPRMKRIDEMIAGAAETAVSSHEG
jgi:NADH dehydrogenase